jgi:diguanylate cyclase (GGDEF)-like protein
VESAQGGRAKVNILSTLRRWNDEDRRVRHAAYLRNLHVIGIAAGWMLALNLLYAVVFGFSEFDDPVDRSWARQICLAHLVMILPMAVVGWWCRRTHAQAQRPPEVTRVAELSYAGVVLWARGLTAIDQAIGTNIIAYVIATVGVSIVLLVRPLWAVAFHVVSWCVMAWTLSWSMQMPAMLTSNLTSAAAACILGAMISGLLWRRFVQTELLQAALKETNRTLEANRMELQRLATRDPLTELINRREFMARAEQELTRAHRQGLPLALAVLDLDEFKSVNDLHGHLVGDEVLREVARVMADSMRKIDLVGRFGGEEFVILLAEADEALAFKLAESLRLRIAGTRIEQLGRGVTASLGLVCVPGSRQMSLDAMFRLADRALYKAKHNGRNRTTLAEASAILPVPLS